MCPRKPQQWLLALTSPCIMAERLAISRLSPEFNSCDCEELCPRRPLQQLCCLPSQCHNWAAYQIQDHLPSIHDWLLYERILCHGDPNSEHVSYTSKSYWSGLQFQDHLLTITLLTQRALGPNTFNQISSKLILVYTYIRKHISLTTWGYEIDQNPINLFRKYILKCNTSNIRKGLILPELLDTYYLCVLAS